jgi:hypothetical protein
MLYQLQNFLALNDMKGMTVFGERERTRSGHSRYQSAISALAALSSGKSPQY